MEPKGIVAASQPQWISVTDRLPKVDEDVIVYAGENLGINIDCIKKNGNWSLLGNEVTHWMPIPEPPMEGSE